jgi:hypothetical protein
MILVSVDVFTLPRPRDDRKRANSLVIIVDAYTSMCVHDRIHVSSMVGRNMHSIMSSLPRPKLINMITCY